MAEINKPVLAGQLLDALYHSVRKGEAINNVAGLIEQLLDDDVWREVCVIETGQIIKYDRFEDFVTTPPVEGLGTTVDTLKQFIGDDMKVLDMLDIALQGKGGKKWDSRTAGKNTVYNIHSNKRPAGTSRQASIRRLRKDRPDLHQKVMDGDMTPNAAMIEARFRPRSLTLPYDPFDGNVVAKKLLKKLTSEQINQLIVELTEGLEP